MYGCPDGKQQWQATPPAKPRGMRGKDTPQKRLMPATLARRCCVPGCGEATSGQLDRHHVRARNGATLGTHGKSGKGGGQLAMASRAPMADGLAQSWSSAGRPRWCLISASLADQKVFDAILATCSSETGVTRKAKTTDRLHGPAANYQAAHCEGTHRQRSRPTDPIRLSQAGRL